MFEKLFTDLIIFKFSNSFECFRSSFWCYVLIVQKSLSKQTGAMLVWAQVKQEVIIEVLVKVRVDIGVKL